MTETLGQQKNPSGSRDSVGPGNRLLPSASPRAIVSCFQALLNPSSQIDCPVALVISHYLYTIRHISFRKENKKGGGLPY